LSENYRFQYPPVPQTADHSFGSALPSYPTQNIPRPYSAARTSRRRANSGQLHMIRLNAHQMHGTMTFDGDRNNVNDSSEALPASDLIVIVYLFFTLITIEN
jgi:hypothetical protein